MTFGSPFAILEPWIWRRLEPVPACFFLTVFCSAEDTTGIWWMQRLPRLCYSFSGFFLNYQIYWIIDRV